METRLRSPPLHTSTCCYFTAIGPELLPDAFQKLIADDVVRTVLALSSTLQIPFSEETFEHTLRPIFNSTSSARLFFSALFIHEGRRRAAANRRVSRTVREGSRPSSSWVTNDMIDSTTDGEASAPLKSIRPRSLYFVVIELFNLPAILRSSDVLPDPDGPLAKAIRIRMQILLSWSLTLSH